MFNLQQILIEHFVKELQSSYHQTYSSMEPEYANILGWAGQLALENIGNADTLYHNVEHTIMVTLVGQAILRGKHLCEGGVTPRDWLNFILALLCHDIGYVKGICRHDCGDTQMTGIGDATVTLPSGGTCAALKEYHVDRSKLFVRERFGSNMLTEAGVDIARLLDYVEMTRFPSPTGEFYRDTTGYGGLARAADFIGQLGDPKYVNKTPALFYEFAEIGANQANGYRNPGDMRRGYAEFYWKVVSPLIQPALRYLRVTHEGRIWIANLHAHVFDSEHYDTLM